MPPSGRGTGYVNFQPADEIVQAGVSDGEVTWHSLSGDDDDFLHVGDAQGGGDIW